MNSCEAILNGINEPGAHHTWIIGTGLTDLDRDIKKLHRTHSYKQMAAKLGAPQDLVKRRVRYLIKWKEIRAKKSWSTARKKKGAS